jgi:hypothetical protein
MGTKWLLSVSGLALWSLVMTSVACSASDDSGGGGKGGGGNAANGGSGNGSGGINVGGGTGGIAIDSGTGSTSGTGGNIGDACAVATSKPTDPVLAPADIIWAVDQSGSMNQETAYVQQQINTFANQIAASNIDYHVVMIASTSSGNAICVPPPLSGGSCGDGPRFRLVNQSVDSNDALSLIIQTYPQYSDFLRMNAVKHFVVVSDDNPTDAPINSAAAFTSALANAQPPGMFQSWKFHSIYAFGVIPVVGCFGAFGTGAAYGTILEQLVTQTGGAKGEICLGDWTPVFAAIQSAVVQGAKVSCEYDVPDPGAGQTLDPNKVNVQYFPGGQPPAQTVYRVNDISQCTTGGGQGGWYFDNNAAPTKIFLCPDTCTVVQADSAAKIEVQFGCESQFKPPA